MLGSRRVPLLLRYASLHSEQSVSSTPPTARRRFAAPYEQLGEVDNALADGKASTPADDAAIQALVKRAETKIARRTERWTKAQFSRSLSVARGDCVLTVVVCVASFASLQ